MDLEWLSLRHGAVLPDSPGCAKDFTLSLYAVNSITVHPGKIAFVDTGVVLAPQSRHKVSCLQLTMPVELMLSTGLCLAGNCVIANDYTGQELGCYKSVHGIIVPLLGTVKYDIRAGDKIAELLVFGNSGRLLESDCDYYSVWSHEYQETHDYDYWDEYVRRTSTFSARHNRPANLD